MRCDFILLLSFPPFDAGAGLADRSPPGGDTMELARMTEYKGVIIAVYKRSGGDYRYTTSDGLTGCGQKSDAEAEQDAKRAIDRKGKNQ